MPERDASKFIQSANAARSVQETLRQPETMVIIRAKADRLRKDYPQISDDDLGWLMLFASEEIAQAVVAVRSGMSPPQLCDPSNLSVLFLMIARELLELSGSVDRVPPGPD